MIEYGLLGAKLGHSYSKPIHNLLSDYSYELYAVTPEQLRELMTSRAFKGLNVTIPYKRTAFELCDELTPEAERFGNVNVVVRRGGKLFGGLIRRKVEKGAFPVLFTAVFREIIKAQQLFF